MSKIARSNTNADELADDIAYLAQFPQESTARDLRITVLAWRNLIKGWADPRVSTVKIIRLIVAQYQLLK